MTFAEDTVAPSEVQSLGYGVMLYEYFQDHHFQALTEFAIAESRNDLGGHGSHPMLMEGGISLAFGMDKKAEAIFQQLLDGSYTPGVESQAWFYLAKIAYQRGGRERAESALANAEENLPRKFLNEFWHMRSNIAIADGNFKSAEKDIASLAKDSPFAAYGSYNLAVVYQSLYSSAASDSGSSNIWQHAVMQFDNAADQALDRVAYHVNRLADNEIFNTEDDEVDDTREFKALADRAYLAAGHVLIQAERYDAAIDRFRKVRLEGPFAASAMLGYGWAAMELEHFQVALTPWQHLSEQSLIDAAVQESYLAIPHLYEKLNAPAQALSAYEKATASYEQELQRIDKAMTTLRHSDLLDLFVVEQPDGFINWVALDEDKVTLNPKTAYLKRLFAQTAFQALLSDLRDLHTMQANLHAWSQRADMFDGVLNSRNAANADMRDKQAKLLQGVVSRLQARREMLVDRVRAAEEDSDVAAFLSGDALDLHQRSLVAEQKAQKLQDQIEVNYQLDWSEFLSRVSLWQAQQAFSANKAAVNKSIVQIDREIAQAMVRDTASSASALSDQALSRYAGRITKAKQGLAITQRSIEASIARAEQQLVAMATDQLLAQQKSIRAYLVQARLATTRLYDNGAERSQKDGVAL